MRSFLIDFIAYTLFVAVWLTRYTLPYDPLPITFKSSKSFFETLDFVLEL